MRSGIIAKKMGMTRLFMEDGKQIPVTVLQMDNLQVVDNAPLKQMATQLFNWVLGQSRPKTYRKRCADISPWQKLSPSAKWQSFALHLRI